MRWSLPLSLPSFISCCICGYSHNRADHFFKIVVWKWDQVISRPSIRHTMTFTYSKINIEPYTFAFIFSVQTIRFSLESWLNKAEFWKSQCNKKAGSVSTFGVVSPRSVLGTNAVAQWTCVWQIVCNFVDYIVLILDLGTNAEHFASISS